MQENTKYNLSFVITSVFACTIGKIQKGLVDNGGAYLTIEYQDNTNCIIQKYCIES